jgi:hypothetical protein
MGASCTRTRASTGEPLAPPLTTPAPVAVPEAEGAAEASSLATTPRPLSLHGSHEDFCPDLDGVLSFGPGAARKAARVALAFNNGLVGDDRRVIAAFIDPWPGALNLKPRPWDHTRAAHGSPSLTAPLPNQMDRQ